jgi:hypothetical protein
MDSRIRTLTEYMRFRIDGWREKGLTYEQIGKQKLNSTKVTANDLHKGKRTVGLDLATRIAALHHKGDYNAMYAEAEAWAATAVGRKWLEERGMVPAGADLVVRHDDGSFWVVQVKSPAEQDARALGALMAERLAGAEVPEEEWLDFLAVLDVACKRLRRNINPPSPRARSVPPSGEPAPGVAPPSSKAPGRSRSRMKTGLRVGAKA